MGGWKSLAGCCHAHVWRGTAGVPDVVAESLCAAAGGQEDSGKVEHGASDAEAPVLGRHPGVSETGSRRILPKQRMRESLHLPCTAEKVDGWHRAGVVADRSKKVQAEAEENEGGGPGLEAEVLGHEFLCSIKFGYTRTSQLGSVEGLTR